MNWVSLDLDGVVVGPDCTFFKQAVLQLERLVAESQALITVHSARRRFPEPPPGPYSLDQHCFSLEWLGSLFREAGARAVAGSLSEVTRPAYFSSSRSLDIYHWLQDHRKDRVVIIDDELRHWSCSDINNHTVIHTDPLVGLTEPQVDAALAFFGRPLD